MVKILSLSAYNEMKQKADNFDQVAQSVAAKGEGIEAADVTLENIQAVINADETVDTPAVDARITELESQVGTLTTERDTLTTERDNLQEQVSALSELPGVESVTAVKPAAEASAVATDSIVEFANKNKGNTLAIVAEMEKAGLV